MNGSPEALDLVTFGETMVLHLADDGRPLAAATTFRRSIAGAEANVAIGLARLGHRVGWFGRLGSDTLGTVALAAIRESGVDTSRVIRDRDAPTGLIVRDRPGLLPVEVAYYRSGSAGSRLAPGDVDPEYVRGAGMLHLTGITPVLSASARAATRRCVEIAAEAGVVIALDLNVRRKLCPPEELVDAVTPLLAHADVVLAGEYEAALFTGTTGAPGSARWFTDAGAKTVVIKLGEQGAYATQGGRSWHQPAVSVTPVDPIGAGDAFAAGFLSAVLHRRPVPDALAKGCAVAAAVLTTPGDVDGLPGEEQVAAILAAESDALR